MKDRNARKIRCAVKHRCMQNKGCETDACKNKVVCSCFQDTGIGKMHAGILTVYIGRQDKDGGYLHSEI
jgi:hypothetical protein